MEFQINHKLQQRQFCGNAIKRILTATYRIHRCHIFIQGMRSWLSRSSPSLLEIHKSNDGFEIGNGIARNWLWRRRVREILTRHREEY